jgi:CPA2 family monovalent cation:H+ antiporter-2
MGMVDPLERWLRARPRLWDLLSRRAERRARELAPSHGVKPPEGRRAVLVGYGPAGQAASAALLVRGIEPVIVEANVDTVQRLVDDGRRAIYGDARRADVLAEAGLVGAELFLVTSSAPELAAQAVVVARTLDPKVRIIVRARFLSERDALLGLGADAVTVDEEAVAGGLATLLMREPEPTAAAPGG